MLSDDELDRVLTLIETLPGAPAFVAEKREIFEVLQRQKRRNDLLERVRKLIDEAGIELRDAVDHDQGPTATVRSGEDG